MKDTKRLSAMESSGEEGGGRRRGRGMGGLMEWKSERGELKGTER